MRAAAMGAFCGPEMLEVRDVEEPDAEPGLVRGDLRAADAHRAPRSGTTIGKIVVRTG